MTPRPCPPPVAPPELRDRSPLITLGPRPCDTCRGESKDGSETWRRSEGYRAEFGHTSARGLTGLRVRVMCHRAHWLLAPRAWLPAEIPRDNFSRCIRISWGFYFLKICWACHAKKHLNSLTQGSNPHPLEWKHRVLTSGSPGKSLYLKKKKLKELFKKFPPLCKNSCPCVLHTEA